MNQLINAIREPKIYIISRKCKQLLENVMNLYGNTINNRFNQLIERFKQLISRTW